MNLKSIGLSIIIPTYNRPSLLKITLSYLLPQLLKYDEVILVDNSENKSASFVVRQYIKKYKKCRLLYLHESKKGPSYARNTGIAECKNNIVAFLDDDCIVNNKWVGEIKKFYNQKSKNFDILQGKIIHRFGQPTIDEQILRHKNTYNRRKSESIYKSNFIHFINAGNFACSIDLIKKYELFFNERDFPYIGEEKELAERLNRDGNRIYYSDKIVVLHCKINKSKLHSLYISCQYGYYFGKIQALYSGDKNVLSLFKAEINQKYNKNQFGETQFILKGLKASFFIKIAVFSYLLINGFMYQVAYFIGYHMQKRFKNE